MQVTFHHASGVQCILVFNEEIVETDNVFLYSGCGVRLTLLNESIDSNQVFAGMAMEVFLHVGIYSDGILVVEAFLK